MYRTFEDIEKTILAGGVTRRIALMNAQVSYSLHAVVDAKRRGIVTAALLGDCEKIKALLDELEEPREDYILVENPDSAACARQAVAMCKAGEADYPMKGLMQTTDFMRAILDKEHGLLPAGGLLSQSTIVEYPGENRFLFIADCAINIAPDFSQKMKIINNTVGLAHRIGIECPKVAVLSALEVVNPKIQSTVDAFELQKANEAGTIPGCIVNGPLALDNAVSKEAAAHKGVTGPVAGNADILIVPDLAAGNIFTKSLTFFAKMNSAGTLLGTSRPVIAASRTDTPQNKYNAILIALLQDL